MNIIPQKNLALHFIGIGGIGMSGIAEVLHQSGFKVQGSDINDSYNTKRLENLGIEVFIGHSIENLLNVQAVVVSTDIRPDNIELVAAISNRIPVMHRADMLAEIMRHRLSIAISGTHGKTTTTSIMAWLLDMAGLDPTIVNGGIINEYNTNARLGNSDWAVVEADESDGSFTRLPATVAVVTNIDAEHMSHYVTFEKLKDSFASFVRNTPFYGAGIMCIDHPVVKELSQTITDRRIVTYGFDESSDVCAKNIRLENDGVVFDVHVCSNYLQKFRTLIPSDTGKNVVTLPAVLKDIKLPMMGRHNIQNALAAITVSQELGLSHKIVRQALLTFKGVKRRFTQVGSVNGVKIIDDYAHHPAEIKAVIASAKQATKGKIYAVVQPHRYSRVKDLFNDFVECFVGCEKVFVSPIYTAGESPNGVIAEDLVNAISKQQKAEYFIDTEKLFEILEGQTRNEDIILFMGAGNITQWAYEYVNTLESHSPFATDASV